MSLPPLFRPGRFLGAGETGRICLLGAPLDVTASYRPGSRFAPGAIREASNSLEEYSLALDRELGELAYGDLGDLELAPGEVGRSLAAIEAAVGTLTEEGRLPFLLGGEHLVTLPAVRAVHRRHADLVVLHLDAHADLREEYGGETLSHATVLRRVAELLGAGRVHHFGIRSATRSEAAFAREHTHPFRPVAELGAVARDLAGQPCYLTVDIDVLDPAYAPGTGTPEPGGISSAALLEALAGLAGINLAGLDLVEVLPASDPSGRTAVLAAKILREAILLFG